MKLNEKIIEYDSYDFVLIPPGIRHILYESDYDLFDNYVLWHMKKGLILATDQASYNDEDMIDEAIKFINVNITNARIL